MTFPHKIIATGSCMALVSSGTVAGTIDWQASVPASLKIAFCLLPVLPFAVGTLLGTAFQESRAARILSISALAIGFTTLAGLFLWIKINPDPQGGLILIFGPIYAGLVMLPFFAIAFICWLLRSRPGAHA